MKLYCETNREMVFNQNNNYFNSTITNHCFVIEWIILENYRFYIQPMEFIDLREIVNAYRYAIGLLIVWFAVYMWLFMIARHVTQMLQIGKIEMYLMQLLNQYIYIVKGREKDIDRKRLNKLGVFDIQVLAQISISERTQKKKKCFAESL